MSPNGAAFNPEGMISLALLDQVVAVDEAAMTVTVQAGATVRGLTEVGLGRYRSPHHRMLFTRRCHKVRETYQPLSSK
jgi:hypothetical protein